MSDEDRERPGGRDPDAGEHATPPAWGPIDLIKAVGSWVIGAIATLVVVWSMIFAATRGDMLGLGILAVIVALLAGFALLRRRR